MSSVQKHIQRLSSSGRSSSLPDEDLTPDEQELLADSDECAFSWQEDKLLLEINEEIESPDVFGKSRARSASGKSISEKETAETATVSHDTCFLRCVFAMIFSSEHPVEEGVLYLHIYRKTPYISRGLN